MAPPTTRTQSQQPQQEEEITTKAQLAVMLQAMLDQSIAINKRYRERQNAQPSIEPVGIQEPAPPTRTQDNSVQYQAIDINESAAAVRTHEPVRIQEPVRTQEPVRAQEPVRIQEPVRTKEDDPIYIRSTINPVDLMDPGDRIIQCWLSVYRNNRSYDSYESTHAIPYVRRKNRPDILYISLPPARKRLAASLIQPVY